MLAFAHRDDDRLLDAYSTTVSAVADEVGVLIFPHLDACRALCPQLPATASVTEVLAHDAVRARFAAILDELAAQSTGSANRVARAMLLDVPPSIDISEMTDKGSINQRAVLKNRAAVVEELYGAVRSPRTIVVKGDVHAG